MWLGLSHIALTTGTEAVDNDDSSSGIDIGADSSSEDSETEMGKEASRGGGVSNARKVQKTMISSYRGEPKYRNSQAYNTTAIATTVVSRTTVMIIVTIILFSSCSIIH